MDSRYDYLLVGGGLASVWAAQNIRQSDDAGTILIVGDEPHPPYDRPPLSKNFLTNDEMKIDDPYSKFDDFYPKNRIDLRKSTRVTQVDRQNRSVTLESGETIGYGKLLLATGARARKLDVPGAERAGAFYLRHLDDSVRIREALRECSRCVIIGAGYIGVEVTADALARGKDVTVVEAAGNPWTRFASEQLGRWLASYYQDKGAKLLFNDEVAAIEGEGDAGAVTAVLTKSGRRLPADFVLIATGAELNLDLARQAGLEVDDREGVRVNEFLQTSDPNIWAAGDIACFNDLAMGKQWHAEHFLNAKWQGQAVGKIMAGGNEPYNQVPYFFSDFLDLHMILRGDPQGGRQSVFSGDVAGAEFTELYHDAAGRLTMGVAISHEEKNLDPISDSLERLIRARVNIGERLQELAQPGFDLNSLG